jgi:mono/diheme cytochrome c family protein
VSVRLAAPARLVLAVAACASMAATAAAADQSPQVNYMIHCMGCHLADGSGAPPQVPDVRGEMGRLLGADGGREYLVQIPGAATSPISDRDLAAVINYMLQTFSAATLPAAFAPFTEDEVKRLRPQWLNDPEPVRRRLLETLAPQ